MNRLAKFSLIATGAALLTACTSFQTSAVEPVELDGTSWMLPMPKGSDCATNPVLEFASGRMSGDLGCNRANGSYKIDGNKITFGPVAVTRRMCAPSYMQMEDTMLNAINNVKTLVKNDKGLTFYDGNGKALVTLVPEKAGACD